MAVKVIGAGLAGCEAAWQLAKAGIDVELYEMKPKKFTPAHKYMGFAELVCSNSLKADRIDSAAGMLKEEMRRLGSVTMECAAETKVSAGGALAVDRKKFSDMVTAKIMENPHKAPEQFSSQMIMKGSSPFSFAMLRISSGDTYSAHAPIAITP